MSEARPAYSVTEARLVEWEDLINHDILDLIETEDLVQVLRELRASRTLIPRLREALREARDELHRAQLNHGYSGSRSVLVERIDELLLANHPI